MDWCAQRSSCGQGSKELRQSHEIVGSHREGEEEALAGDAFELRTRKPAKGLGPAERGGTGLDGESAAIYSGIGRPSIAPERLLRGSLLQIIFSVRPERQLMEQMDYNLMFRWFVGLGIDDPVWDHSVYSKNRTPELGEEAQDTWRSLSAS